MSLASRVNHKFAIEVECQSCNRWFALPFDFSKSKAFQSGAFNGEVIDCLYCRETIYCHDETRRIKFENWYEFGNQNTYQLRDYRDYFWGIKDVTVIRNGTEIRNEPEISYYHTKEGLLDSFPNQHYSSDLIRKLVTEDVYQKAGITAVLLTVDVYDHHRIGCRGYSYKIGERLIYVLFDNSKKIDLPNNEATYFISD
jgi:hypothetical protein